MLERIKYFISIGLGRMLNDLFIFFDHLMSDIYIQYRSQEYIKLFSTVVFMFSPSLIICLATMLSGFLYYNRSISDIDLEELLQHPGGMAVYSSSVCRTAAKSLNAFSATRDAKYLDLAKDLYQQAFDNNQSFEDKVVAYIGLTKCFFQLNELSSADLYSEVHLFNSQNQLHQHISSKLTGFASSSYVHTAIMNSNLSVGNKLSLATYLIKTSIVFNKIKDPFSLTETLMTTSNLINNCYNLFELQPDLVRSVSDFIYDAYSQQF